MIVTADEDDLLAVGVGTRNHNREGSRVAAVLCEERPVRHIDGVDHLFGEVDEQVGGEGNAVALLHLFECGGVDVGVVIAEEVGAVGAHIVDESVAVEVPEVSPFCLGHKEGIGTDGNHTTFGGAEVTVNTGGDDLERALERLLALCDIVYFLGFVTELHNNLLRRDRC